MHKHENDERFIFLMAGLAEATGQEASPMKIKIYAKGLEDLSIEALEAAAWKIIRERKTATFPKVAEIREAIHGSIEDHAQIALNTIEQAIEKYGNGHADTVVFYDPYIHAVMQSLGGWIAVSNIYWTDEWKFFRKDVMRTYSALSKIPLDRLDIPLRLVGWHDKNNEEKQVKHACKVYQIGDVKQIEAWQRQLAGPTVKEIA